MRKLLKEVEIDVYGTHAISAAAAEAHTCFLFIRVKVGFQNLEEEGVVTNHFIKQTWK